MNGNSDNQFWIEKVLQSPQFASTTDNKLLRYLVDATLKGASLKELVIAIDVFGRDARFNPSDDSLVRSSIYNLRKKLDLYYLDEGRMDEIRIRIPKGRYLIEFEKSDRSLLPQVLVNESNSRSKVISFLVPGVLLLIVIITFYLYIDKSRTLKDIRHFPPDDLVWSDFIQSDQPLLIVIGDYFIVRQENPQDSLIRYLRLPRVNSDESFFQYRKIHPETEGLLKKAHISYLGEEIPYCISRIFEVFSGYTKKIQLKLSSELTYTEIRDNDIIFLGDYSTVGLLDKFFHYSHYSLLDNPDGIIYKGANGDVAETIVMPETESEAFQNDYAFVAKIRGNENKRILFILSFKPFGKAEAIYKLTSPEFTRTFSFAKGEGSSLWDMLIKVSGIEKNGFFYEVLHFDPIMTDN